jgi:hypothetical protein
MRMKELVLEPGVRCRPTIRELRVDRKKLNRRSWRKQQELWAKRGV